jgi:hypothetical protein
MVAIDLVDIQINFLSPFSFPPPMPNAHPCVGGRALSLQHTLLFLNKMICTGFIFIFCVFRQLHGYTVPDLNKKPLLLFAISLLNWLVKKYLSS